MKRIREEPPHRPATDLEARLLTELANLVYVMDPDKGVRWKDLDAHVWHRDVLKWLRRVVGGRMD